MKEKRVWIVALVLVLLASIMVYINVLKPKESALEKKIHVIASDFYENFYYTHMTQGKTQEEIDSFLQEYSETGIKINIENLSRFNPEEYADVLNEFQDPEGNVCDPDKSGVIIYPKTPFSITDY